MLWRLTSLFLLASVWACSGPSGTDDSGVLDGGESSGNDAGLTFSSSFENISVGLPTGRALRGAAQLDSVLYVVMSGSDGGSGDLYALSGSPKIWAKISLPVSGKQGATAVTRLDRTVYATFSDGAQGALFSMQQGEGVWARVTGVPAQPIWAVTRKGSDLLLASSGGLLVSSDNGALWAPRSTDPLFDGETKTLVAAAAQQRIFVIVDDGAGGGTLYYSDDGGKVWQPGPVQGVVNAVAATKEWVLAQSSSEGSVRSENYGNTFHSMTPTDTPLCFAFLGTKAFAGTAGGLISSENGGESWLGANNGLPTGSPVTAVFAANTVLVVQTASGLFAAQY